MKVVIQRVSSAQVEVAGEVTGKISAGYLILLGIEAGDEEDDRAWLIKKTTKIKLFDDDDGKMSKNLLDINGQVLVVSQFTLHASTKKGTRPSFHRSARPEIATEQYDLFCDEISTVIGKSTEKGIFGADMKVSLTNDGPVTLILDSKNRK